MQISFDPLDSDAFDTDPAHAHAWAQRCRNKKKRELKAVGFRNVRAWRLTGQLRKYKSFGVDDGRVRTVYYISYEEQ